MGWLTLHRLWALGESPDVVHADDDLGAALQCRRHPTSRASHLSTATSFTPDDGDPLPPSPGAKRYVSRAEKKKIQKMKDIRARMMALDHRASTQRAAVMDAGSQIDIADLRRRIDSISAIMKDMQRWSADDLGAVLRQVDADRLALFQAWKVGPKQGQPFEERDLLNRIAYNADKANQMLGGHASPAMQVAKIIKDMDPYFKNDREQDLYVEDVELIKPLKGDVKEVGAAITSSGCYCDPGAQCGLQGQPFNWCIVHRGNEIDGDECLLAKNPDNYKDPLGRTHVLKYDPHAPPPDLMEAYLPPKTGETARTAKEFFPPLEGVDRHWDYCTAPQAAAEEQEHGLTRIKTSHTNCHCAPRDDILQKYLHDPQYLNKDKTINFAKVPFNDRITVAIMKLMKDNPDESLCQTTQDSGNFFVCPVSHDCLGVNRSGNSFLPRSGNSPSSAWFTGTSPRSWDFCSPPAPVGEGGASLSPPASLDPVEESMEAPVLLILPLLNPRGASRS